jgi:hypothetical protein
MPSVENIEVWTIDETLGEIARLLPEGTVFVEAVKEGWHTAFIQRKGDGTTPPEILWQDHGPDRRILLLNAFGWLWLRGQKTKHPAWKPRTGNDPVRRHPAHFPNVPDPPDLDPEKLRAVYEKGPKRKN